MLQKLIHFFSKDIPMLDPKNAYNLWAASYAEEVNPIKELSDSSILSALPDLSGKNIFDLGCGTGYFCSVAENRGAAQVIGVDISSEMIIAARKQSLTKTDLRLLTSKSYPVDSDWADVIICALVLGHVDDLKNVVSECRRTLKKNGIILITDFHWLAAQHGAKRTFCYKNKTYQIKHYIHTHTDYQNLLLENEFEILAQKDLKWNASPAVYFLEAVKKA